MAFLSHLPQLTASALMEVVGRARLERRAAPCRPRPDGHDASGVEPGEMSGATCARRTPTTSAPRSIN